MHLEVSKRIPFFNFLMTIVIAVYHCNPMLVAPSALGERWNTALVNTICDCAGIAMSTFFLVTGYLLFYTYRQADFPKKILRRIRSLLIPFILWNLIAEVILMIRGNPFDLRQLVEGMFLLKFPPNSPLWYLYAVFLLALLSPVLYLMLRNWKIGWGLSTFFIIFICALCQADTPFVDALRSYGYLANIFTYLPPYIAGVFLGIHARRVSEKQAAQYFLGILVLAFLVDGFLEGVLLRIVIRMTPILLLYLVPVSEQLTDCKIYRTSFFLYATHVPLFESIQPAVTNCLVGVIPSTLLTNILTRVICVPIAVLLAVGLYAGLKRFLPWLLGPLTGGRAERKSPAS